MNIHKSHGFFIFMHFSEVILQFYCCSWKDWISYKISFFCGIFYAAELNKWNIAASVTCLKTLLCITFVQLELFYQEFLVSVILREKWTSADIKFGPPVLQESRSHVATINGAVNELISPGDRHGIFTKFCFPPNHSSKASCRSGVMERGSAETWVVLLIWVSAWFWL